MLKQAVVQALNVFTYLLVHQYIFSDTYKGANTDTRVLK